MGRLGRELGRAIARGGAWPLPAVIALILASTVPAKAGGPHALLIEDANSGAVLINQDGDEPRHPASLTKMMTLYLTFEALEHGRLSPQTRIKISEHAADAAPSKLELAAGDDIALEDAVLALITKSANDVAIAIAEHIGGTEQNFAQLMTAKARELGMKNTTFKNASGLPDSAQITTARDMVTLGLRLYDDYPRQFPLFATRSFSYNGATFKNHNTLMLQMPGINGIKTGYTSGSGFNLVTSYAADGKHLIGAIFGGETATLRNVQMRVALSKAMTRASSVKTRKPALVAQVRKKAAPAPVPAVRKAPAPATVADAAPAQVQPAPSAASPGEAAPGPAPFKIEVAKVRPVTLPAVASAPQPPAPQQPPRTPTAFETQMASLARNIVPGPANTAPAAAAASPAAQTPPAVASGVRPPSTLNAQLASLQSNPAIPPQPALSPPVYRLKGPAHEDSALGASGGFEIQIGAYGSPTEAEKGLAAAAAKFAATLDGHVATRQSVNINGKLLYRARFGGFDAAAAANACAEFKQAKADCLVLKAE